MGKEQRTFNSQEEIAQGSKIAEAYGKGKEIGWLGKDAAAEAFKVVGVAPYFRKLDYQMVKEAEGKKMFLYRVVRAVLGKDTPNYPQEIGDCVSFGAKNAAEYLECCEILMKGDREVFRSIYPPYYYGTGRVFSGGGRISGDGSTGAWMADAVVKYGSLASDEEGVPKYSGSVAKKWGNRPGPPENFVQVGKKHLIKSAAQINSWEELVAAVVNGYPVTIASDQGFRMEAGSDGFHAASGSWAHQMCVIGVDDEHATPYALILNSWGDSHGHLKSFDGEDDLPIGILRAKKSALERIIRQQETYAYSNLEGFPAQPIDEALFKIVGKT